MPGPCKAPHFVCAPGRKLHLFYYLLSIYYLQHSWYDIPNPNIYHKKERSILTTNEKIAALRAAAKAAGADGVLICRPFVTAVYGGGEEGVKCYIDKIAAELADTMQMCGAHSLAEITRDMVRI